VAAVAGITSFRAGPVTPVPLGVIGWLSMTGFSYPPYADLTPAGRPGTQRS
jgi:hypothetical protein